MPMSNNGWRHWVGTAGGLLGVLLGGAGLYAGLAARHLATQLLPRTAALEQRVTQMADEAAHVREQLGNLERQTPRALPGLASPGPPLLAPTPPPPAPAGPPPPVGPAAAAPSSYTIQAGDTFATIAQAHGLTVEALAQANPGVAARRLQIGQTLKVPVGTR